MTTKELTKKSTFVQENYSQLAKAINPDITDMWYVHHSLTNEEWIVIEYKTGYKKKFYVTGDNLKAIVWNTIVQL